jgi:hypothetical protein
MCIELLQLQMAVILAIIQKERDAAWERLARLEAVNQTGAVTAHSGRGDPVSPYPY